MLFYSRVPDRVVKVNWTTCEKAKGVELEPPLDFDRGEWKRNLQVNYASPYNSTIDPFTTTRYSEDMFSMSTMDRALEYIRIPMPDNKPMDTHVCVPVCLPLAETSSSHQHQLPSRADTLQPAKGQKPEPNPRKRDRGSLHMDSDENLECHTACFEVYLE